jgi:bifunctional DNA-binding transcriptional regulator/antitoxin component of YhaV-PrlF toxin-antitoxin module
MEVTKLGKKGQVSIPQSVLNKWELSSESLLSVETTAEGGILLQPAGVYPIRLYNQEHIEEFAEADTLTPAESELLAQILGNKADEATLL